MTDALDHPSFLIVQCQACNGDGWTVEPVCCGRSGIGGCCGSPDPMQVQCEACSGTGRIEDEVRLVT